MPNGMVDRRPRRESIWSVRAEVRNLYSWLFTALMLAGSGYIFASGIAKTLEDFWGLVATLSIATATISLVTTEIGGSIMVIASWALDKRDEWREKRRQRREERRQRWEERRQEGRREAYAEWEAWNTRRVAAERNGSAFDEPPPSLEGPSIPRQ